LSVVRDGDGARIATDDVAEERKNRSGHGSYAVVASISAVTPRRPYASSAS
jgi:hypothetical protein